MIYKGRLAKKGSQLLSGCYQLMLAAANWKTYATDVATVETPLRKVTKKP